MTRARPLIVVSDDDESVAELYVALLSADGFRCISIPDKRDLLNLIGAIRPDLVITDIGPPRMRGLELLEGIRGRIDVGTVPVIVVSAEEEYANQVLALGVRDFIAKPFEVEAFVEAVTSAIVYSPWPEDSN